MENTHLKPFPICIISAMCEITLFSDKANGSKLLIYCKRHANVHDDWYGT